MKVRVEKFCSLATSPSWQAWLFNYDEELYRAFMKRLRMSRGCDQNRTLMIDTLRDVEARPGGSDSLLSFLMNNYPHVLVSDDPVRPAATSAVGSSATSQAHGDDDIFEDFNPNILTYPRRQIFIGDPRELNKKVSEFMADKIAGDSVILGNKAYVEYLTEADRKIRDKIPIRNWRIAAWRARRSQT